jgi:hypothetical protein
MPPGGQGEDRDRGFEHPYKHPREIRVIFGDERFVYVYQWLEGQMNAQDLQWHPIYSPRGREGQVGIGGWFRDYLHCKGDPRICSPSEIVRRDSENTSVKTKRNPSGERIVFCLSGGA